MHYLTSGLLTVVFAGQIYRKITADSLPLVKGGGESCNELSLNKLLILCDKYTH